MSEIVNLKRHRKRLARADKETKAQENRERFGRSKVERRNPVPTRLAPIGISTDISARVDAQGIQAVTDDFGASHVPVSGT